MTDYVLAFSARPTSEFPHPLSRVKQQAGYRVILISFYFFLIQFCFVEVRIIVLLGLIDSCHIKLLIRWSGLEYETWLTMCVRRSSSFVLSHIWVDHRALILIYHMVTYGVLILFPSLKVCALDSDLFSVGFIICLVGILTEDSPCGFISCY